jgi:hypothetical protein
MCRVSESALTKPVDFSEGHDWLCSFADGHLIADSLSEKVKGIEYFKSMEARRALKSREASASDFKPVYKVSKADQSRDALSP